MTTIIRPTSEYYAFSGLSYETFEKIDAIYALFYAITQIPDAVSEPSIAHQKCQFYRMDIASAGTHPLCKALRKTQVNMSGADWEPILIAAEIDIDNIHFSEEQDFERYAHKKYGALYRLIAKNLSETTCDPQTCNNLGYFIAQVIRLQCLHMDEPSDNDQASVKKLIQRAENTQINVKTLPSPLKILYYQYRAILRLVAKRTQQAMPLRAEYMDTSPLKKLLIARFPFMFY